MAIFSLLSIILSNSITVRQDKSLSYNRIVIISLLLSFNLCFISYNPLFLGKEGIGIYGGLFYIGSATHIFQLIIFILSSIILILTAYYPTISLNSIFDGNKEKKENNSNINTSKEIYTKLENSKEEIEQEKQEPLLNFRSLIFNILEYPLIILFIINGALFVMCTSDLISVFISIELQSYGLYIISTIYKDSELSTSGGLMYFLLGGLSSCFILLGGALLYANSGTTNLDNLYIINDISNASIMFSLPGKQELMIDSVKSLQTYTDYYIIFSLIFIAVGFLFKVSAAPFHFWSPDVYDSIPTVVTTFVAIIAKLSIFILLLEIMNHFSKASIIAIPFSNSNDQNILNYYNNPLLANNFLLSSLLSLILGTVLGLSQTRIKRLFAYSTISHIGFILFSLSINSVESIQAFFFYLAQYSFSNLNAFLLLVCIGYTYHYYINTDNNNLKDKNNSPIQLINQLIAYFTINPTLSLSVCITLFSFTGIPPLVGFFGKMMVLSAGLDKGYIFMCLLAIVTSVISAGYYLYVIKQMFFYTKTTMVKDLNIKNPNYERAENTNKEIILSDYLSISISLITLFISLFILTTNECLNITCILALMYI